MNKLPADQPQREIAKGDLATNLLVEASAGTGKTTVLVDRLIQLVTSPEVKARLRDVVAITFTEKAAGELKAKLRDKLEETLTGLGKESGPQEADALSQALEDLDQAHLGTIHSFCASLLRERPVEAGIDPEFEVTDPLKADLLEEEVWREWLERVMSGDHQCLRAAATVGLDLHRELRPLCRALNANRDLLGWLPSPVETPDVSPVIGELGRIVEALCRFIGVQSTAADDRTRQDAHRRSVAPCGRRESPSVTPTRVYAAGSSGGGAPCCRDPNDRAAVAALNLAQAVSAMCSLGPAAAALAAGRLEIPKAGRLGAQKNWADKQSLARVRELLDQARDVQERFGQSWGHAIVSQIAARCRPFVDDLSHRKEEQALLDFQDLLLRTRDMLQGNREARRYFKREFSHLLVDEFQDTDPLQTEIVFFLAEQEGKLASDWREVELAPGKLFVVGDPKQSIYRFRRADIELFQQVGELLTQTGGRVELSQNFRSLSGVIDRANDLFAALIRKPEEGNYQPDYVPLVSWWERPGGAVLLYPPASLDATRASADECRANEATCLAEFIQQVVTTQEFAVFDEDCERPLKYSDIALLFRVTTGLDAYEDALRDYGIPYLVTGGRRFYARQEIKALVAVLRAVDNPQDEVALYAALKSPFFGLSDEQLFLHFHAARTLRYTGTPTGGGPVSEALDCLRRLHAGRNRGSTPRLLWALFEETKALELFALKPLGEQRVANLLKVIDTARTLETTGGLTFRQFVSWLRDMEQSEQEEAESPTAEKDDDFVNLLTVHKAKGLEYPLVILANPAGGQPHPENLLADRSAGALHLKLGSSKLPFQSSGFATAQERERLRWEAEEIRLFYVAVTRAKNWFVMPVGWNKGGLDKAQGLIQFARPLLPTPEQAIPGQVVNGWHCYDTGRLGLKRPAQEPFRVPLDPDSDLAAEAEAVLAQRKKWHAAKGETVGRASRAPVVIRPSDLADEDRVHAAARPSDAPGGKLFGELVHRLLEETDAEDLMAVAARAAADLRLPTEVAAEAVELVEKAHASPLLQRAQRATEKWHELPFSLKTDEGTVEGAIDLVFREGDRLVVVDFKTDQVGPDGAHEAAQAYAPQLQQYAGALEKLTGRAVAETIVFFLRPRVEVSLRAHSEVADTA